MSLELYVANTAHSYEAQSHAESSLADLQDMLLPLLEEHFRSFFDL
jgi:hypothetical protein